MPTSRILLLAATLLPVAATLPFPATVGAGAGEPPYTFQELGTLGGSLSVAVAINDLSQVAGSSSDANGDLHAFLWLPRPALGLDAGMHDLGTLGGRESDAHGLDRSARVVGFSGVPEPMTPGRAFLWQGVMNDLGDLGPDQQGSRARGINDLGEAAGSVGLLASCGPAVWLPEPRYGFPAGLSQLPLPAGWTAGTAHDINNRGEVVGFVDDFCTSSDGARLFLWLPSPAYGLPAGPHDLTPGTPGPDFRASARAINENGEIVGHFAETGSGFQPFLWRNGQFTLLPLPGSTISGEALAINDHGQAVGFVRLANFDRRAVLWDGGEVYFIRDLVPPVAGMVLEAATGINRRGQIVGEGFVGGARRAWLVSPVGGPALEIPVLGPAGTAALALLLSAAGAVLLAHRRPASRSRSG